MNPFGCCCFNRRFDRQITWSFNQNRYIVLDEFGGEGDHIHLLMDFHPNVAPSKFINSLKTVTSRLIRKEFPDRVSRFYCNPVLWTRAYCLISAGGAPLAVLKQYIENQDAPKT
ncbi:MAG: IS200/IS605 family transposase [Candidatus Thiodiazotropha sp. L084R]